MLAFLDKISFGTPLVRRILFWLLIAFTAYVLIGFLVVPPVLKSVILDQCKSSLHRQGSVQRVAFNPLTLRLEIDKLAIAKREGEGDFVSVDRIDASPSLSTLWRFAPVISHLHLRSPKLDVTFFGDGKYSISDLIGARDPAKRQTEPVEEEPGKVFPFALYGFEMTNATIVFDDRPHEKKHVISKLDLIVPFTSSFTSLRKEFTQPKFSAVVNGDPIKLDGRTLPFDESMLTEFKLGAVDVDLHQYWAYLPMETPLLLQEGRFTSEISLFFERPDAQRVNLFLGGGGHLTDFKLADKNDGTVLSMKKVSFEMEKYSLGDNEMSLKSVTLDKPYFKIIRLGDGAINWGGYFPQSEKDGNATDEEDTSLILNINKITLADGELDWQDRAVEGGFKHVFGPFALTADDFTTNGEKRCTFKASAGKEGTLLTLDGSASLVPPTGNATLGGKGLELPQYAPYFAHALPLELDSATLDFSVPVSFAKAEDKLNATVNNGSLSVKGLVLRKPDAKEPTLSLDELAVSGANVDIKGQDVTVDEVRLTGPDAMLVREKSGELDLVRLFAAQDKRDAPAPAEGQAEEAPEPWTGTVKGVRLSGGKISLRDMTFGHPVTVGVSDLSVSLDDVTTREGASIPYAVSAKWGGKGSVETKGKAVLSTPSAEGTLTLRGLPLSPLDKLLAEFTELLFASGDANANLEYSFKGGDKTELDVTGKAALTDVQLKDTQGGGEFAGLRALTLSGLRLTGEPYHLDVGVVHLQEPRLVVDIDGKGHSNVRRAFRMPQPEPESEATDDKAIKEKEKQDDIKLEKESKAEAEDPDATPFISIGKVTMDEGELRIHDASVAPPYSTTLSEMKLVLTGIAQTREARPKMDFRAKIGPTPMTVTGILNPVISPIYSDLALSVNGMEMVPLSPYTIKSLAYPIEKGRLYADVKFKTEQWELEADNKFFIEQLVLGPKDKRPGAPNVPVQFGLSLLQDDNGNLELDLPIRGRLDDPDFRIGGLVMRAVVSLFFKALASPFSLIGSIFGGGDNANMDFVSFDPGRHVLDKAAEAKLDTVTKALKAREKLKLEVDGVVDPQVDSAGLVRHIFETKLKQQKYDSLSRKERAATTVDAMVIEPSEYEEILFQAYKDEDDPEGTRPTTLFVVDRQPVAIMEKFILDRIKVTDHDLSELAVDRARAVKEYVIAKEPDLTPRVFLLDKKNDRAGKAGVPRHRADLGIK
jgi:uncharacterized protein involved in outer membrane biogenesis